jgi:Ca2+-binding RTX toxin-like protein
MAVYRFSTLSNHQAISFDPETDRLYFDDTAYSAARVNAWWSESEGLHVYHAASGVEVVLLGMSRFQVTTSNITFADGSRLLWGDNALASGDDNANSLTGTVYADNLHGWGGDDTLRGGAGNDALHGGNQGDRLEGGGGRDVLEGGDDQDTLYGDAGADTLYGGAGNDRYGVESAGDRVIEFQGGGRDLVISSLDSYALPAFVEDLTLWDDAHVGLGNGLRNVLTGTAKDNSLYAGDGDDRLLGGGGDDWLGGDAGNDTMAGGAGDDHYLVDSGDVIVEVAGNGTDRVHTSFLNYTLPGAVEELVVSGNASGTGNGLDNRLFGGAEYTCTLRGSTGDDTLDGGGWGTDVLVGGSGADEFRFTAQPDRYNADRIVDFVHGTDSLVLLNGDAPNPGGYPPANTADYGAAGRLAANDARFYAAAGATSGHDASDRLVYNTVTGKLYYDPDGSGSQASQLVFTLSGAPVLAASDITIVDSVDF